MQLPPMWQLTPIAVVALAIGAAHELGLRRLALRQSPARALASLRRAWLFYLGLALVALVGSGPLEHYAMEWLAIHMAVHVLEMFFLPILLIAGGPQVPLWFALSTRRRRRVLIAYYRSRRYAPLRGFVRWITRPVVSVVAFNVVMVTWHLPVVFDWASWNTWAMDWLMTPSFVCSGLLFWRVILGSGHSPPRGTTRIQAIGIVATALEMLVLAMSMSILAHRAWYSMNVAMLGAARAFHDQQLAAAVLWICSDLWAVPALILVIYRAWNREPDLATEIEEILHTA